MSEVRAPRVVSIVVSYENSVENITALAATAEVLATIVNTFGPEKPGNWLDAVPARNVCDALLGRGLSLRSWRGALM